MMLDSPLTPVVLAAFVWCAFGTNLGIAIVGKAVPGTWVALAVCGLSGMLQFFFARRTYHYREETARHQGAIEVYEQRLGRH